MKKIVITTAIILATIIRLPAQHQSSIAPEVITLLTQQLTEKGLENREVKMLIVEFKPGSASAPHRHPCPTFGFILEGEIESEFEGKIYHYKKGDSFYEPANGLHRVAKNNDVAKTARLLVFFIAENGKPTSIKENEQD
jgi:quercetin dioxygenase-like cupin family protein